MPLSGIVGSAASAIGGIVSGGMNLKAQREANRANLQINQMNNDFNERMMQKQMDYNTTMWNRQNEYNTASAQRQRLEAAGLNPYLMMNGGNAGTASSAGNVSAASAASAAPQQAARFDFSPVTQALSQMSEQIYNHSLMKAQVDKTNAEAQGIIIDNKTRFDHNLLMNDLLSKQATGQDAKNKWQDTVNRINDSTMGFQIALKEGEFKQQLLTNSLYSAQVASANLNVETQRVLLSFLPQQQIADLMQKVAQLDLTGKLTEKAAAETVLAYAVANGHKISNRIAEKTAKNLIKALNASHIQDYNYYNGVLKNGKGEEFRPWKMRLLQDHWNFQSARRYSINNHNVGFNFGLGPLDFGYHTGQ